MRIVRTGRRRPTAARTRAGDECRDQRAERDGGHAEPDGSLPRPVPVPANGYAPAPDQPNAEYLHSPAYGAAVDNAGNADCEVGQRGYPLKLNHFDPSGRQLDTDQYTPVNQGPTFMGRARVPAGETFSRNPLTGPQLSPNPANP